MERTSKSFVAELKKRGFVRRKDLDFEDDGNHFKGYELNGIEYSYLYADGDIYLDEHIHYYELGAEYEDWKKQPESSYVGEFNGVSLNLALDNVDKIVENNSKINEGINNLKNYLANEVIDMTRIDSYKDRVLFEEKNTKDILEDYKQRFSGLWFTLDKYEVNRVADYMKSIERYIKLLEQRKLEKITRRVIVQFEQRKYVKVKEDCFYVRELKEILEKHGC